MFMRGDAFGVTIDTARWGSDIPYLAGANTTPLNMFMSPMMIMYPRRWQDAYLTECAERNYSHYTISADGWNFAENNFEMTPSKLVQWALYLKSWGFFVNYWRGQPVLNDQFLIALVEAGCIDWSIPGGEVDRKISAEQYEQILDDTLSIVSNGIPVGAHFTPNYPEGFPRDTFFDGTSMKGWDYYDGRVHLMWQAHQNDSAGKQAAMLYYARERVNLGLVGGNGELAPNSRVYAFETMASAQLDPRMWTPPRYDAESQYGTCTEEYGCLRSLELLYATRRDNRILPVSGSNNGLRYPNGGWV